MDIANSFNNFFALLHQTSNPQIKQTFKPFHHHLTNPFVDSFLTSPCTKKEILEMISNFDNNKATGINRIPLKILKLPKEPIAENTCIAFIIYLLLQEFFRHYKNCKGYTNLQKRLKI